MIADCANRSYGAVAGRTLGAARGPFKLKAEADCVGCWLVQIGDTFTGYSGYRPVMTLLRLFADRQSRAEPLGC